MTAAACVVLSHAESRRQCGGAGAVLHRNFGAPRRVHLPLKDKSIDAYVLLIIY
jgi:hypothetical protein